MRIRKKYTMECAHSLPGHKGKCASLHGHSYKLFVTVEGNVHPLIGPKISDGGMVMDFGELDELVFPLVDALDHTFLNVSALEVLGVKRTTAELLAQGFADAINGLLPKRFPNVRLVAVRLYETEKCYAEWTA